MCGGERLSDPIGDEIVPCTQDGTVTSRVELTPRSETFLAQSAHVPTADKKRHEAENL
jgi:esterase/lipase